MREHRKKTFIVVGFLLATAVSFLVFDPVPSRADERRTASQPVPAPLGSRSPAFAACRDAADVQLNGRGVSFDRLDATRAIGLCEAARAESPNDPWPMAYLARALSKAERHAEAFDLARRSAAQRNPLGETLVGLAYDDGKVIAKDEAEAVRWYSKAAKQSYAIAQSNLGWMYRDGRGVARNDVEAVRLYRKAAEQGYSTAQTNLGWMYENGRGVAKDDVEAVRWYSKAAEQGLAFAQTNLGAMYRDGRGVARNDVEAVRLYRKAAEQGYSTAQTNLGWMYENGRGVAKDDVEAVGWYRKAAEQGDAYAQTNLGVIYATGRGVAQNDVEAVGWFRKAAEQGNAAAQGNLGLMYAQGRGVAQNDVEAVGWFRKAAEQGYADAQTILGLMYEQGRGVAKDEAQAVGWYRKAAEQGQAAAQGNLGLMYAQGRGVTKDDVEAVQWFQKAAEQGVADAQNNLGRMYANGRGVAQNDVEAVGWYRKAAEQGLAAAQNNLGVMYDNGRGVAQNDVEAVGWFRKAAEQGYADAQKNLGLMYEQGRGVAKDDVEAASWYRKAAEQGDAAAQGNLGLMYKYGLGIAQDDVEAVGWYRKAAEQSFADAQTNLGGMYAEGRGVAQNDVEAVSWYRKAADQGDAAAKYNLGLMYAQGRGVAQDDVEAASWYRKAAEQGFAAAQGNLGLMYAQGRGVAQNDVEAVGWYRKAAEQGFAAAQGNLGLMYAQGRGVAQNDVEAVGWFRKAAEQGDADAQTNLGAMYEKGRGVSKDETEAMRWYLRAAQGGNDEGRRRITRAHLESDDPLHTALAGHGDVGSALKSAAVDIGATYEETVFDCYATLEDCGEIAWRRVDLEQAAFWYRISADDDARAAFRLGRLLLAHPELAKTPDEGSARLHRAAASGEAAATFDLAVINLAALAPARRSEALAQALAAFDALQAADLTFDGATGRFGDEAIGPSFDYLRHAAEGGAAEARIGLISVYAFYGAFGQAAKAAADWKDARWFDIAGWDYSIDHLLSFWLGEVGRGFVPKTETVEGLRQFLAVLVDRGSTTAGRLVSKLDLVGRTLADRRDQPAPAVPVADTAADIEKIRNRIAEKEKLGGFSPLLFALHRQLAAAQAASGHEEEAATSYLTALSIAEQLDRDTRHLKGSLVYHLEQSCQLRKASEDLAGLGRKETALALAKAAVNELQDARADLAGLPSELQGCFRDLVSDQYRVLADVFIRQGHFLEAEWVLGQLKDYETYEFNRSDPRLAGTAFAHIPLTDADTALLSEIVGLPLIEQYRLGRRLTELKLPTEPTEQQKAERADIEERLAQSRAALQKSLASLQTSIAAFEAAGAEGSRSKLDLDLSASGMRRLSSQLRTLSNPTAILYTVVLPDHVDVLVSTRDGFENVAIAIPEPKLNELIGRFRSDLQERRTDPRTSGKALYDLLWKEADRQLQKLGVGDVVLSLDRQLRYVPFTALYDGKNYLVERYRSTVMTAVTGNLLLAEGKLGALTAQGLGVSKGGSGFSPLVDVEHEIDAIVKAGPDDATGLLPGGRWLDDAFSLEGFGTALSSGSPIVHIATHFSIGTNDDTSMMLLGRGGPLSLRQLKTDIDAGTLDFGGVKLLVLSACETAIGNGEELESLAATLQKEGPQSVVATLWPVVDGSTASFMVRFYAHLIHGLPPGEALRQAQLDFIHGGAADPAGATVTLASTATNETRGPLPRETGLPETASFPGYTHPRYWAPFDLMGQWK